MKTQIIYIYGSPAVGKLTTAKALKKLTGFPIIDNHLSVNPIREIMSLQDKNFWKYVKKLRNMYLEIALKENFPGAIITSCHPNRKKESISIQKRINLVKKYDGEIHFVWLSAKESTILKRVIHKSRIKRGKLLDAKELKKDLTEKDFSKPLSFIKSLNIDTEKSSAKQSAEKIVKHFKLKTINQ